jgi:hypothetical protein
MVEHSACETAALHLFFSNYGVHIWKGWVLDRIFGRLGEYYGVYLFSLSLI